MFNPAHPGRVLREWLGEMQVKEAAARLASHALAHPELQGGHLGGDVAASLRCAGNQPRAMDRLPDPVRLVGASRKRRPKIDLFDRAV